MADGEKNRAQRRIKFIYIYIHMHSISSFGCTYVLWSDTEIQKCFHSPIHCLRVSVLSQWSWTKPWKPDDPCESQQFVSLDNIEPGKKKIQVCLNRVLTLKISGWWFQIFFIFTPKIGEDSQFDLRIFFKGGWNHQPVLFLDSRIPTKVDKLLKEVGGEGREIHAGIEAEVWWVSGGFPGFKKR